MMNRFVVASAMMLATVRLAGAFAPIPAIGRRAFASSSLKAGDDDFADFSSKVRIELSSTIYLSKAGQWRTAHLERTRPIQVKSIRFSFTPSPNDVCLRLPCPNPFPIVA